jgi:hypothetical protein
MRMTCTQTHRPLERRAAKGTTEETKETERVGKEKLRIRIPIREKEKENRAMEEMTTKTEMKEKEEHRRGEATTQAEKTKEKAKHRNPRDTTTRGTEKGETTAEEDETEEEAKTTAEEKEKEKEKNRITGGTKMEAANTEDTEKERRITGKAKDMTDPMTGSMDMDLILERPPPVNGEPRVGAERQVYRKSKSQFPEASC